MRSFISHFTLNVKGTNFYRMAFNLMQVISKYQNAQKVCHIFGALQMYIGMDSLRTLKRITLGENIFLCLKFQMR